MPLRKIAMYKLECHILVTHRITFENAVNRGVKELGFSTVARSSNVQGQSMSWLIAGCTGKLV